MKIELINNQDKVGLDLGLIEKVSTYVSNKFDLSPDNAINIILSDSSEIRKLNEVYRNISRTTDVLSFSYLSDRGSLHGKDPLFTIGEIYICPEVAKENAKNQDQNWSLDLEIILLVIHGILHIYDYDHEEDDDRIEMENLQECIIVDIRNNFGL
ncbi:MAG: rRNA maturation RNase YbeY, partial [Actinomycetia bacterium]|nr:rRNA maturation RNase YbeY [Actinomycetes bacterium]